MIRWTNGNDHTKPQVDFSNTDCIGSIAPTVIKVLTAGYMDEKLSEQEEKVLADDGEELGERRNLSVSILLVQLQAPHTELWHGWGTRRCMVRQEGT